VTIGRGGDRVVGVEARGLRSGQGLAGLAEGEAAEEWETEREGSVRTSCLRSVLSITDSRIESPLISLVVATMMSRPGTRYRVL
jgi:hypothetical protein